MNNQPIDDLPGATDWSPDSTQSLAVPWLAKSAEAKAGEEPGGGGGGGEIGTPWSAAPAPVPVQQQREAEAGAGVPAVRHEPARHEPVQPELDQSAEEFDPLFGPLSDIADSSEMTGVWDPGSWTAFQDARQPTAPPVDGLVHGGLPEGVTATGSGSGPGIAPGMTAGLIASAPEGYAGEGYAQDGYAQEGPRQAEFGPEGYAPAGFAPRAWRGGESQHGHSPGHESGRESGHGPGLDETTRLRPLDRDGMPVPVPEQREYQQAPLLGAGARPIRPADGAPGEPAAEHGSAVQDFERQLEADPEWEPDWQPARDWDAEADAAEAESMPEPTPEPPAAAVVVEHPEVLLPAAELAPADQPATDLPAANQPAADEPLPHAPDGLPPLADGEHPTASYTLRVNGMDRLVHDGWIGESLLFVLRERLGLAGAKSGCDQGECGACSVQVDGRLVAACLVPAALADGQEIRTVEGLSPNGTAGDVQQALAESGAVQCGYCVPGLAMAVEDLLERDPNPTDTAAREGLCGNLCRCTGYRGALAAVRAVAGTRRAAQAQAHADAHAEARAQAEARGGGAR